MYDALFVVDRGADVRATCDPTGMLDCVPAERGDAITVCLEPTYHIEGFGMINVEFHGDRDTEMILHDWACIAVTKHKVIPIPGMYATSWKVVSRC